MRSTTYRTASLLLFTLGGQACAGREVPTRFPEGSPASIQATRAPADPVTAALDSDPPLPGEPTAGWPGLEPHDGAAPAPAHQHKHGASTPSPGGQP